ncbi:hypothetical protein HC928_20375 [bacterium]|nr:hypothetical protein [bacterium]
MTVVSRGACTTRPSGRQFDTLRLTEVRKEAEGLHRRGEIRPGGGISRDRGITEQDEGHVLAGERIGQIRLHRQQRDAPRARRLIEGRSAERGNRRKRGEVAGGVKVIQGSGDARRSDADVPVAGFVAACAVAGFTGCGQRRLHDDRAGPCALVIGCVAALGVQRQGQRRYQTQQHNHQRYQQPEVFGFHHRASLNNNTSHNITSISLKIRSFFTARNHRLVDACHVRRSSGGRSEQAAPTGCCLVVCAVRRGPAPS